MVNVINPFVRKRIGWKIKVVLRRVRGNTMLVVGTRTQNRTLRHLLRSGEDTR